MGTDKSTDLKTGTQTQTSKNTDMTTDLNTREQTRAYKNTDMTTDLKTRAQTHRSPKIQTWSKTFKKKSRR